MSHQIMLKEDESRIVTHRLSAKKSSYSMLIKEYFTTIIICALFRKEKN